MFLDTFQAKGRGNRKPTTEELEERHKQEIAEREKYIKELEDKVFEQDILGAPKQKGKPKRPETDRERMLRELLEHMIGRKE